MGELTHVKGPKTISIEFKKHNNEFVRRNFVLKFSVIGKERTQKMAVIL